MSLLYILDADHNAELCPNTQEWRAWFENEPNRRVACDSVLLGSLTAWVSTVFLGINQSSDSGPPVLFETMVCRYLAGQEEDAVWDKDVLRYCTWNEALAGHARRLNVLRLLATAPARG